MHQPLGVLAQAAAVEECPLVQTCVADDKLQDVVAVLLRMIMTGQHRCVGQHICVCVCCLDSFKLLAGEKTYAKGVLTSITSAEGGMAGCCGQALVLLF